MTSKVAKNVPSKRAQPGTKTPAKLQGPGTGRVAGVENPALFLSPHYGKFKRSAALIADVLKPLGLSISSLEKGLAQYVSKGYTFEVDRELLTLLQEYQEAKVAWESFRDTFRAQKDAETIPAGALAQLLGQAEPEVPAGAGDRGEASGVGVGRRH
jgi:hypothetical protein